MPSDALRVALHIYAAPNTARGAAQAPLPEGVLATIRDHYRCLIRGLHPDREGAGWHAVLQVASTRRTRSYAMPGGVLPMTRRAMRNRRRVPSRFTPDCLQGAMQRPPAGRADAVAQRSSCGSRRWQRPCSSR